MPVQVPTLDRVVAVRFQDRNYQKVIEAALAEGMRPSAWLREVATKRAELVLKRAAGNADAC